MNNDLISRAAAIECLEHLSACDEPFVEIGTDDETFIGKYEAITEISDLPSAQPEIIHCRDCIHAIKDGLCGGYWCKGKTVKSSHFCGYAERRTDE